MRLVLDTHPDQVPVGETGVTAEMEVYRFADGSHIVVINGWSSTKRGAGNTNRALLVIRERWPGKIVANDIGLNHPSYPSYSYWTHQLRQGRIDAAYDDEGVKVQERPGTD